MGGWIKKGGATSNRSRTPARCGPLFGRNVLIPCVKSVKSIKTEKERMKKRKTENKQKEH
jgi:hypothetical protein